MSLPVMLVMVAIIEGFLHYALRREILGKDLPRLVAYVLGTLGMMVPFSFWLWENNCADVVAVLWKVLFAGGASVLLWYGIDWAYNLSISVREMKAREQVAMDIVHEVDDATK